MNWSSFLKIVLVIIGIILLIVILKPFFSDVSEEANNTISVGRGFVKELDEQILSVFRSKVKLEIEEVGLCGSSKRTVDGIYISKGLNLGLNIINEGKATAKDSYLEFRTSEDYLTKIDLEDIPIGKSNLDVNFEDIPIADPIYPLIICVSDKGYRHDCVTKENIIWIEGVC